MKQLTHLTNLKQSLSQRAEQKVWGLVETPATSFEEYLSQVARIQELMNLADEVNEILNPEQDEQDNDESDQQDN